MHELYHYVHVVLDFKLLYSVICHLYMSCCFFVRLALRIHVSPSTKQILDDLSGYKLIERGPIGMKVYYHGLLIE